MLDRGRLSEGMGLRRALRLRRHERPEDLYPPFCSLPLSGVPTHPRWMNAVRPAPGTRRVIFPPVMRVLVCALLLVACGSSRGGWIKAMFFPLAADPGMLGS
jgi:hypothetical protein